MAKNATQTTESSQRVNMGPWGAAQPALKESIPEITSQYQADKANPLVGQAQDYVSDTLSGNYLSPSTNPHLGDLIKSISDPITANVSSMFSRAGRGTSASSSGLAGALSSGLASGLAAPLFSQYNTERGLQQGAAQMAPAMSAASSIPLDQMIQRLSILGGLGRQGTTRGTSTTESQPSTMQTVTGALMTGLGLMGGMPSFGLAAAAPQMLGGMTTPAGWW